MAAAVRGLQATLGKKGYKRKWREHELPLPKAEDLERRLRSPPG